MGIFNYESKFMQTLIMVADYMILNFIFILCCIPIFTIGAAQAGLYAGVKQLLNKEDDTSCLKCFFQGFRSGFGTITIVWCGFLLIIALLVYCFLVTKVLESAGFAPPEWMILIAIVLCAIIQANLTIFHANFGCTKMQLIRSVFFNCLAHPIRSVGVAALTWIPVICFLFVTPVFLQVTPFWVAGYYTIAFLISTKIMAKPYQTLTENFVEEYEKENGEIEIDKESE